MNLVSVIICTYRPRNDYLQRVLEALRAQTMPKERWELLLIDNASQEPLAATWDLCWHPNARHIREDTAGLTMARQRGIHEAKGDLLIFVDDDNVLDSRYLETAVRLAKEWPQVGVFGGSQIPEYEQEPLDEIKPHLGMLAVRTIAKILWTNLKGIDDATPRGAGLCLRRDLGARYAQLITENPLRRLLGRTGSGLLSGEDTDIVWSVCDEGYGMLVSPELKLTHLIDKRRLDKGYLLKLNEGHAASGVVLANLHQLPQATSSLIVFARESLRILQAPTSFDRLLRLSSYRGQRKGVLLVKKTLGHS